MLVIEYDWKKTELFKAPLHTPQDTTSIEKRPLTLDSDLPMSTKENLSINLFWVNMGPSLAPYIT